MSNKQMLSINRDIFISNNQSIILTKNIKRMHKHNYFHINSREKLIEFLEEEYINLMIRLLYKLFNNCGEFIKIFDNKIEVELPRSEK